MKETADSPLTQKQIFLFWLPLMFMWMVMAVEQPGIAAMVARLPDAKTQLAAFGVTLAIALIIESPILQLLTAATALGRSRQQYRTLLRFMHLLGAFLTLLHLVLAFPPVFRVLLGSVVGAPPEITEASGKAFLLMVPFAASVGYRRLWQGVLIGNGRTDVIPVTMIIRLLATAAVLVGGYFAGFMAGAQLGAAALTVGVAVGALAAYLFARPIIRALPDREQLPAGSQSGGDGSGSRNPGTADLLDMRGLLRFYVPLALTSMIALGSRPILTAGIARSPLPRESLAVWPVLTGFMFLFNAAALSYQEVVVSLYRSQRDALQLRRFAIRISLGTGAAFLTVALSPLSRIWFDRVAGLPPDLLALVRSPLLVLWVVPFLFGWISWYRGVQVHFGRTPVITQGVVANLVVLVSMMLLGTALLPFPGAVSGSIAFAASFLGEVLYLRQRTRRLGILPQEETETAGTPVVTNPERTQAPPDRRRS